MTYSSYAGNSGPLYYHAAAQTACPRPWRARTPGSSSTSASPPEKRTAARLSPVKLAEITDGTSNTIMLGEKAYGQVANAGDDRFGPNWWTSGLPGDTTFSTFFPPNFFKKLDADLRQAPIPGGPRYTNTAHEPPSRRRQLRASATARSGSSRTRSTPGTRG